MRAKLSVAAGPDGGVLVALQLRLRQPREPNALEIFMRTRRAAIITTVPTTVLTTLLTTLARALMRTRLAEIEAQDSGKEAAAQSSAEAAEAAASVHKRLMAEWKAMGRKAARQAENAAKGVSKRYRGQHVRASLEVNSLGGVRLRMFISTISTAGTACISGKGGFAPHDPALHPALHPALPSGGGGGGGGSEGRAAAEAGEAGGSKASKMGGGRDVTKQRKMWPVDKPAMAISLFLAERKLELQDLAAAMPPDATKNTLDVQNRRKRLHAQASERLSVAPPSAYHTYYCRVHAARLTAILTAGECGVAQPYVGSNGGTQDTASVAAGPRPQRLELTITLTLT